MEQITAVSIETAITVDSRAAGIAIRRTAIAMIAKKSSSIIVTAAARFTAVGIMVIVAASD